MNKFDQFIKHKLKVKYYARYTDDFVIVSENLYYLQSLTTKIQSFLETNLKIELHPDKISIRKLKQGIDFLGYVIFPKYRLLRNKTKKRITKKLRHRIVEYKANLIKEETLAQSLNSYLGVLSHADTYNFQQELENKFWFWLKE